MRNISSCDQPKAQLKLAKASVEQAQATLENSEANLSYTKIWSTENGIVIERKVDPGQTVAASFQTPELFVIAADMDKHMHIFGSVDEADIGLITTAYRKAAEAGKTAPVSFTVDAYPGELFQGKIFQIRNNSTDGAKRRDLSGGDRDDEPGRQITAQHDGHDHLQHRSQGGRAASAGGRPALHPDARTRSGPKTAIISTSGGRQRQALGDGEGRPGQAAQNRIVWVQDGAVSRGRARHAGADRPPVCGDRGGRPGRGQKASSPTSTYHSTEVSMLLIDLMLISLRTLAKNKLRSVLTVLGIVIGIAAVTTMVSIGHGAEHVVRVLFRSLGANIIAVIPANSQSGGIRQGAVITLTEADSMAISAECPAVLAATPLIATTRAAHQRHRHQLEPEGPARRRPRLSASSGPGLMDSGEFFSQRDVNEAAKVCVIGTTIVTQLFPDVDPIGQTVRIKNMPFRVIGVLARKGGDLFGRDQDDIVVMPYSTVRKRLQGSTFTNVNAVLVSARSQDLSDMAEKEIKHAADGTPSLRARRTARLRGQEHGRDRERADGHHRRRWPP